VVSEVVRLQDDALLEDIAAALARALAADVTLLLADEHGVVDSAPTIVQEPLLPWPAAWSAGPPAEASR
jgi:hypothetical protein